MPEDPHSRLNDDTARSADESGGHDRSNAGRRRRRWLGGATAFVLLLVLTTFVVPNVMTSFFQARCPPKAHVDITSLDAAAKEFALRNGGKWPNDLAALVKPDASGERFLDQERLPKDPWGRAYRYDPPRPGRPKARIYTLGSDGAPGGSGSDADVDNRDMR